MTILNWNRKLFLKAALLISLAPGAAFASCYGPDQRVSAQKIATFLAHPAHLLSDPELSSAGNALIVVVRDLVASDPTTLPVIIGLLGGANKDQQAAIGSGLGQAAGLCIRPDPNFAAEIQQKLAASDSEGAKLAYAGVTGNQPIGSTGGGGSPGGVGGSISGPPGSAKFTGNFFVYGPEGTPNIVMNYFNGGVTPTSRAVSPP